jgi:hypothetical protein
VGTKDSREGNRRTFAFFGPREEKVLVRATVPSRARAGCRVVSEPKISSIYCRREKRRRKGKHLILLLLSDPLISCVGERSEGEKGKHSDTHNLQSGIRARRVLFVQVA